MHPLNNRLYPLHLTQVRATFLVQCLPRDEWTRTTVIANRSRVCGCNRFVLLTVIGLIKV